MIVFDLKCGTGHVFEAWFGSSGDYDAQRGAGLLRCPVCDDARVEKAVMAPAVATKGNRGLAIPSPVQSKAAMQALAAAQARILSQSTWVGPAFAEQARAMHLGERDHAAIHGQATLADAKALAGEGVPIAPLPLPVVPPKTLN